MSSDADVRTNWLARYRDPELENHFMEAGLEGSVGRARSAVWLLTLVIAIFIGRDLIVGRDSRSTWGMMALRASALVVGCGAVWFGRRGDWRSFLRGVVGAELLLGAILIESTVVEGASIQLGALKFGVFAIALFVIAPGRFGSTTGVVGVLYLGHVIGLPMALGVPLVGVIDQLVVMGCFVLVGATASWQLQTMKREGYVAALGQHQAIESLQGEVEARRELQEGLAWMAAHDDLTELLNRRAFVGLANKSLAASSGSTDRGALLIIDADHFKAVNDAFGHAAGDEVLRELAARCTAVVRSTDRLGRIGGEEFAVMLPTADLDLACSIAERICDAVRSEPVNWDGHQIGITVSIGVSMLGSEIDNILDALPCSDRAMYQAKERGRDRVVLAGQPAPVVEFAVN